MNGYNYEAGRDRKVFMIQFYQTGYRFCFYERHIAGTCAANVSFPALSISSPFATAFTRAAFSRLSCSNRRNRRNIIQRIDFRRKHSSDQFFFVAWIFHRLVHARQLILAACLGQVHLEMDKLCTKNWLYYRCLFIHRKSIPFAQDHDDRKR